MNAYILKTNKRIEPFGDHPGDCLVTNKKLSELQKQTLSDMGIRLTATQAESQIQDADEHLVFTDSLFFTRELMEEFVTKSRQQKRPTICAIKPGVTATRGVVATQEVDVWPDRIEYSLRYLPAPAQRTMDVSPVLLDIGHSESLPMPDHMIGQSGGYQIPMTAKLVLQIDHWTNLWGANMAYLLAEAARLLTATKMKQLGLALRARSTNPWRVMEKTNRIGKKCDIHPTAYVEGSTIGDNVTIGAMTTVRQAVVGNNAYLGDNCTVHLSVLGDGCNLQSGSLVEFAVLYPGVCSNDRIIAISMVGRDCFIAGNVIFTNFRLDRQHIMVMKGDQLIDSGNTFLGSCIGHEVYLGAGCVIAPGRIIPNGTRLAPEETHVIRKCVDGQDVPGYRRVMASAG